jgi:RNA polymerase sigma-70 factor (ECF subfamily)
VNAPDSGSFATALFERHGHAIRGYFRRLLGEASTADDLSQEVFLRVVRGSESYDARDRERAWIFRIARNVFLDHQRHRARAIVGGGAAETAIPPAQDVRLDIRAALGRLPAVEREAFLLGEIGGLTYAEIAALTGATVAAVRSRIYRARVTLRALVVAPARLPTPTWTSRTDDE